MKGSEEIRGGVKDSEGSKTGDSVILVSLSAVLSSTKAVFVAVWKLCHAIFIKPTSVCLFPCSYCSCSCSWSCLAEILAVVVGEVEGDPKCL